MQLSFHNCFWHCLMFPFFRWKNYHMVQCVWSPASSSIWSLQCVRVMCTCQRSSLCVVSSVLFCSNDFYGNYLQLFALDNFIETHVTVLNTFCCFWTYFWVDLNGSQCVTDQLHVLFHATQILYGNYDYPLSLMS